MKLARPLEPKHKEPRQEAADRWIVKLPEHPHLTLEDIRERRLPKLSSHAIALRQEAIKRAHEIRSKLEISPATTTELIRRLRSGTEMS